MSLHNDESGVSVIIGTLMLILITITAASGLALMVSGMQKEAMERESHLAAVASENLRIIAIDPVENSTDPMQWGSVNVTIMNLNTADSHITAISLNGVHARNYMAKGASGGLDYYRDGYPVIYNFNKRVVIPAAGSKEMCLNFTEILVTTTEVIDVSAWDDNRKNHTFQLLHSPIVNGSENVSNETVPHFIPGNNYTMDYGAGKIELIGTNYSGNMTNASDYNITYKTMFDTFTPPLSVSKNEPIKIEVITSLINIFKQTFMPPVPLAEVQVKSECVNASSNKFRDVLILDASDSFDPDDGFITEYRWAVWGNDSTSTPICEHLTGMKVRPVELNLTTSHNIEIDLSVRDDTGMFSNLIQRSGNITIP